MAQQELRSVAVVLRELVGAAEAGGVSLSEFHERCPEISGDYVLLTQIREGLEDAITHTPGKWLRGGVDWEQWRETHAFRMLRADEILLEEYSRNPSDEDMFLRSRSRILAELDSSIEDVEAFVRSVLGQD